MAELKDEGDIDETAFADFKKKFTDAVSNDLNTSMAITIVYDVLKADISDSTKLALIDDFEQVLDLGLRESGKALLEASSSVDSELEAFINDKIAERAAAKKAKDFATAAQPCVSYAAIAPHACWRTCWKYARWTDRIGRRACARTHLRRRR